MAKCSKCGEEFTQTESQVRRNDYWCKKCRAEYDRKWQQDNKEKRHGIDKRYYVAHREKRCRSRRTQHYQLKLDILSHYSNGTFECAKCKYNTDIRALCIDHINGGGNEHRRKIGDGTLYNWLKKNNYPSDFQVLCANCNLIKTFENKEHPNKISEKSIDIP